MGDGISPAMRAGPEIAVTTFGGDEVSGKSRVGEPEELKSFVAGLAAEDDEGPGLEEILSRPCGFCLKIMPGGRL